MLNSEIIIDSFARAFLPQIFFFLRHYFAAAGQKFCEKITFLHLFAAVEINYRYSIHFFVPLLAAIK